MRLFFILLLLPLQLHAVEMSETFRQYWYHKGAEMTRYELEQARYGETHNGHAVLVFVSEPFDKDEHVKSDNSQATAAVAALKLNHTRTFNTGIYPYSVMQSIFQPIDTGTFPHVLKTSLSVQEWCGHVFEQYNKRDDGWQRRLFSYFQSEGDREHTLPEAWLEDELWTRLRLDPDSIPEGEVDMIPASLFLRLAHRPAQVHQARISRRQDGDSYSLLQVTYTDLQRELQIRYESAFPHRIESWTEQTARGKTSARKTHRIHGPYWRWNSNADRFRREQLGLDRD